MIVLFQIRLVNSLSDFFNLLLFEIITLSLN